MSDKTKLILNSSLELGFEENDGKGKGKYFRSRFIEPGVAHYNELGDILITKETLNKFINTMVGCPVIIDHKDVTDKNVNKLRVGVVSKVWFNEYDGYFYCEGILTDPEAIDLVKNQGWNVSCAYSFVSDNTKRLHNGKEIDMEFTDGEFLHLALVQDPRYEGANIVVNKNDDDLEWITVKGNHIAIKKGQSKDEAVKEFLKGKKETDSKEYEAGDKITFDTNWRGVNEKIIEGTIIGKEKKLGTKDDPNPDYQYKVKTSDGKTILVEKEAIKEPKDKSSDNKEKEENKESDDYEREADIALTMMAHDYEKRGNEGTVKRANELKEKLKKGEELTEKDKVHIKTAIDTYKPKEHTEEAKLRQKKMEELHETLKNIMHKNEKDSQSISYIPIDAVPYGKTHTQYWGVDETGKTQYTTEDKQKIYGVGLYKDYDGKEKLGFYIDYSDKPHWEIKKEPKNLLSYYGESNAMTPEQFDDVYKKVLKQVKKYKANNNIGDITMSVLNDLKDFIMNTVKNEKEDEMKVKNEDKRKLIDEVGGILKGKVDDEIIRTIMKKMEEASYEPSEDGKADNEDDEKEAKNKCKNEKEEIEEKDEKEENVTKNEDEEKDNKEEKAENKKVKNSMKDLVMGGNSSVEEQKLFISRKERLEEGNKY